MSIMQRPHVPTLLGAAAVALVLIVLYHMMVRR